MRAKPTWCGGTALLVGVLLLAGPARAAADDEVITFKGHKQAVWGVAFSPDGKRLVSGSNDKTVRIWDAENGKEIRRLQGHTASVRSVAFSPDGKRVAAGSTDATVPVYKVAD